MLIVNVIGMDNTYITFEPIIENFTENYQPDINGSFTADGNLWLATAISISNESVNKIHPPGISQRKDFCLIRFNQI